MTDIVKAPPFAIAFGDERLPPRFWAKVEIDAASGCWLWTASKNHRGYGTTSAGKKGRTALSHRFAYVALVGSVPDGLQLDHLCRVRHCVNVEHLQPVTPGENTRRGRTGQAARERITGRSHCPKGHVYAGDNLAVRPNGWRDCRTCHRERELARYHARKGATL